jgi:hypothetical protein
MFLKRLQVHKWNILETARKLKFLLARLYISRERRSDHYQRKMASQVQAGLSLLAPQITRPYSMQILSVGISQRPGLPTSDAGVPSRAHSTGHNQRRWVKFAKWLGRIRLLSWRLQSNQWRIYWTTLDKLYKLPCCLQVVSYLGL